MTWQHPYQRRFIVRMHIKLYIKYLAFAITNYEDAQGNAKCRNSGGLKWSSAT